MVLKRAFSAVGRVLATLGDMSDTARIAEQAIFGQNPDVQFEYASRLLDGVGTDPDYKSALTYLRKAASRGHQLAIDKLEELGEPRIAPASAENVPG